MCVCTICAWRTDKSWRGVGQRARQDNSSSSNNKGTQRGLSCLARGDTAGGRGEREVESRQARHSRTEKELRRQCGNGAWQGKQVTGRVRVAHKTDCGELCELLPQTERERERKTDEEGEREREERRHTACLDMPSTDSKAGSLYM